MMQSLHIKLNAGADLQLQRITRSLWLLGVLVLLVNVRGLTWPLVLLGSGLLLRWALLEWNQQSVGQEVLSLYRSGAAKWGNCNGTWGSKTSISRTYCTIHVESNQTSKVFLISANNNSKDNYRCLLVWCRYLPFDIDQKAIEPTAA
jgi:hypothetical protein